jgi:hypothetical protein
MLWWDSDVADSKNWRDFLHILYFGDSVTKNQSTSVTNTESTEKVKQRLLKCDGAEASCRSQFKARILQRLNKAT